MYSPNLIDKMSYKLNINTGAYELLLDGAKVGEVNTEELALYFVNSYNGDE